MGLLSRFAENKQEDEIVKDIDVPSFNNEFTPFEYDGEKYYVAVRDNVLIFDSNMILIHTLTKAEAILTELPLIKAASEVIANIEEPNVKLFIKRNGLFEKISFHNSFDAIFIFKKLKRVATRPDETIEELFIEDNGAIVEHYTVNHWQRRFTKNIFHRKKETDTVMRIANVEDELDAVIADIVNGTDHTINPEKIDMCIKLLEELKEQ